MAPALLIAHARCCAHPSNPFPDYEDAHSKVFHIRQSIEETHACLSKAETYHRRFGGGGGFSATADGRGLLESLSLMSTRGGQNAQEMELLPTEAADQVLFRSTGGGAEYWGLMELLPVRDQLTEIQLTLDYQIKSPFLRVLDRLLGSVNRSVDRQIIHVKRRVEREGDSGPVERLIPARALSLTPHPEPAV